MSSREMRDFDLASGYVGPRRCCGERMSQLLPDMVVNASPPFSRVYVNLAACLTCGRVLAMPLQPEGETK